MGVSWVSRSPELEPSVKNIVHLIKDHPQLSHLGFIRRPWPSPRQGRRLGPPEVWNLLCHSPLLLRHSSLPLKPLRIPRVTCHQAFSKVQNPYCPPTAALLPRSSCHQAWPSAFAAPGLQPALCLHIPRGPPSSWPSAFQHCSLPFACT